MNKFIIYINRARSYIYRKSIDRLKHARLILFVEDLTLEKNAHFDTHNEKRKFFLFHLLLIIIAFC
jgi:hypothetical protein